MRSERRGLKGGRAQETTNRTEDKRTTARMHMQTTTTSTQTTTTYTTSPPPPTKNDHREQAIIDRIFHRIRHFDGKDSVCYPSSVDGVAVTSVRDVTLGTDSAQPDGKSLLPKQVSVEPFFWRPFDCFHHFTH